MEYDVILQTADKILETITPENLSAISHSGINQKLGYSNGSAESSYVISALRRMAEDKYLKNQETSLDVFRISGNTFQFKDAGGYKTLVEKEKIKEQYKAAIEELGLKSTQSVIDTNTSIQNLNNNTTIFYERQTSFNTWQKRLTIAIMLSTLAYTIISYFMLTNQNKQLEQEKTKSQPQVEDIKHQILQDSIFLKSLRDSLKKE